MKEKNEDKTRSLSKIADQATNVLLTQPGLKLALIYGSAARGRMRPDSDVDIAVLFDKPMSADRKMSLTAQLEAAVQRSVDLVDLFGSNGTLLKQTLVHGHVLVRKKPEDLTGQIRKMIYNQTDMMPYVRRTLRERQKRFING